MKAIISDLEPEDLKNRTVFLRVDFNVPMMRGDDGDLLVANDSKIRQSLPTINYLRNAGAKVVIFSHLGRPDGVINHEYSLAPVAKALGSLIGDDDVVFVSDCVGPLVQDAIDKLTPGKVIVCENTRFYKEEEANNKEFSESLAAPFVDGIYVNDAFGTAHRAHASTEGVTHYIDVCVAGFLMRDELQACQLILDTPLRPMAAVIGGSKISSKVMVLRGLMRIVNKLLIGGGMVFTFHLALGANVGKSLVEPAYVEIARSILAEATSRGCEVILAHDCVIAEVPAKKADFDAPAIEFGTPTKKKSEKRDDAMSGGAKVTLPTTPPCLLHPIRTVEIANDIPSNYMGCDIGGQSVKRICEALKDCKTIVWNGPMGIYEDPRFEAGTNALIDIVASLTASGTTTIVCGGDTVAAVERKGNVTFSHISTGGGALLELLEGRSLPGVCSLHERATLRKKAKYDQTFNQF